VSGDYPQIIPRPERWELGREAPWARLAPEARRSLSLDRIVRTLVARGLAGPPTGQLALAREAEVADGVALPGPPRESSVLVLLFEEDGEARTVLTRRASHLRTHSGEVSFPGGRLDEGEGPVEAAVREAQEEIGLDPALATVVGHLPPLLTWVSGAIIQPVVAVAPRRPELVAAPAEVERVFDVALAELLAEGVFHEERWHRPELSRPGGEGFPLWFFEVAGEMVWGATGRLLVELLTAVVDVPHPGQP
jgi:8-oxo-dGTP pyrophosphatase MutT (NUDIX family)